VRHAIAIVALLSFSSTAIAQTVTSTTPIRVRLHRELVGCLHEVVNVREERNTNAAAAVKFEGLYLLAGKAKLKAKARTAQAVIATAHAEAVAEERWNLAIMLGIGSALIGIIVGVLVSPSLRKLLP